MGRPEKVYRVWRLRKQHVYVDAHLRDVAESGAGVRGLAPGATSVEISFRYNGELSYKRIWPTREDAIAEAAAKRAELEREGWISHW
jgi:hypothetical protein